MSYTGTQIITMAQRKLLDIDDGAYLDGNSQPMLDWINEAQRRFASETHCCQRTDAIALSTGSLNYITFSDLAAVNSSIVDSILYIGKIREDSGYTFLPKSPLQEMKDLPAVSVVAPTRWTPFGENLYFDLRPGATLSFTVTVYYSYIPVDLAAVGSSVLIPDQWVNGIVKYLEFCARVADRDANLANGAWGEYEAIRATCAEFHKAQLES